LLLLLVDQVVQLPGRLVGLPVLLLLLGLPLLMAARAGLVRPVPGFLALAPAVFRLPGVAGLLAALALLRFRLVVLAGLPFLFLALLVQPGLLLPALLFLPALLLAGAVLLLQLL